MYYFSQSLNKITEISFKQVKGEIMCSVVDPQFFSLYVLPLREEICVWTTKRGGGH